MQGDLSVQGRIRFEIQISKLGLKFFGLTVGFRLKLMGFSASVSGIQGFRFLRGVAGCLGFRLSRIGFRYV